MNGSQRPNIVLIMTDQMRGDCLGILGHPDVKTPHLDSLAAEGKIFTNAYSACPTCVPARAVLHTGLRHEHAGRVGYKDCVDWNYASTLAGELSKAGYYTQCVGKMHVHPLRNYLGFHNVVLHDGYLHKYRLPPVQFYEDQRIADDYYWWLKQEKGIAADPTDTGLDCNSWVARPWIYEEKYHPTNWAVDQSIDFLRRRDPRKPFFLMTSFVRPHAPFDAPRWYFDLYNNKELSPVVRGDWNDAEALDRNGHSYISYTGSSDAELIRQQRVGYYACITHIDHQVGRLMSALVEQNLMENTVIVFTSDHGDMMGDHMLIQKAKPYEGSIHIPLFISGAQEISGVSNGFSDKLVELRDLMPTILGIAGVAAPEHLDGFDIRKDANRSYLHGEHALGQMSCQFIVTKKDKYVWFSQTGRQQYFDLLADPHEEHDATHDLRYRERIDYLRKLLIYELDGREEGYSDGKQLFIGKAPLDTLSNVCDKNDTVYAPKKQGAAPKEME